MYPVIQKHLIRTAIFDFDGTLVNSMVYWQKVITDYLNGLGVTPEEGLINIIKPMGIINASAYMIEKYGLKIARHQIVDNLCSAMGESYKNKIPLKPFAKECIARLKDQGINICVATAIEREFVTAALIRTGLMEYIDYLVTIADVGAAKHSARIFENCAERFGTRPQECIIFEDSLMSCQVAKKAGFNVIGVSEDTNLDEVTLMSKICDKFIKSFSDILQ